MPHDPRAPSVPVATIAVVGVASAIAGMLALVGLVMGVGVWWWFACPVLGVLVLIGVQFLFAKALGMPVRGPAEPMGSPADEGDED